MGLLPPILRDKGDLFSWCRRIGDYLRSTVLRGGHGIQARQTDSGVTVSLGKHGDDHAPGGTDEIKFQTLEIVWTDPANAENKKRIIFNPNWSDFLAGRIFCVNDAGTFTAWRTLLDLLDGLSGFAAGTVLKVNATADGLEFGAAGGSVPSNIVLESATTPFQSGKLVLASSTAHELLGTLIGINLAGATYHGYLDTAISTDARVAQIADSRFSANWPSGVIFGSGTIGQIAVFSGYTDVLGSTSLHSLLAVYLGTPPPTGTARLVYYDTDSDLKFTDLHNIEPNAVLCTGTDPANNTIALFYGGKYIVGLAKPSADCVLADDGGTLGLRWVDRAEFAGGLPTGTVGQIVYHNGTAWVVLSKPAADKFLKNTAAGALAWADTPAGLPSGTVGQLLYHNGTDWVVLAKPSADQFLKNTSGGGVSWATPTATVQSSGGTGASLVTSDGKIKTIYGD